MTATLVPIKTDEKQHPASYEAGEPCRDYVSDEVITFLGGTIVMRRANGYASPGATETGGIALGVCKETVRWSAALLALGVARPNVRIATGGVYPYLAIGTDTFTIADKDAIVYIVDNQTISKVATGRSICGTVHSVEEGKVWVRIDPDVNAALLNPPPA